VDKEDNNYLKCVCKLALFPGDLIFLRCELFIPAGLLYYEKTEMLDKVYQKKLIDERTENERYEWTWKNDIGVLKPTISHNHISYNSITINLDLIDKGILKDVTKEWFREEKLKELGI
jgi:hypothetical protein